MKTKIIEATNGPLNHGKFLLGRFSSEWPQGEWNYLSAVAGQTDLTESSFAMITPVSLLQLCGWSMDSLLVFDLQTGEGALFRPGGSAAADLEKHKIWVCPLFEPFLEWLYQQDLHNLDLLPAVIDLPDAPFAMSGYRREGKDGPTDAG